MAPRHAKSHRSRRGGKNIPVIPDISGDRATSVLARIRPLQWFFDRGI
jgi:hypothetical protein